MIYFRFTRALALLMLPLSIVRMVVTQDGTRWSYGVFLAYCSVLIFIIARYAQGNLLGHPRYSRFGALLLATSSALYVTYGFHSFNSFVLGWVLSGWGAASLVNHFNDPRSKKASLKLFLYFLIGDLGLIIAAIYVAVQHINIYSDSSAPVGVVAALALSGLIRSGIFPFHRWLPLTNEAPSPLSALLHAGIVNGFGLMLLSFPSLHRYRLTIIALGLVSIASSLMIMRHRHDEKGKLANGTSMQMAYMAIEGAIGLPGAVLMHIIGHGSYKSWSFLRVGGVPSRWKSAQELYLPHTPVRRVARYLVGLVAILIPFGMALLSKEFSLTLCAFMISATSFLTYIQKLPKRIFLISSGILTLAGCSLVWELAGFNRLFTPVDSKRNVELCVGAGIILITITIKYVPRSFTTKIASLLLGFSGPSRIRLAPASQSTTITPLESKEVESIVEGFADYFEPGLRLSALVAQDPVSGMHHLDYKTAALELKKFGISAYPSKSDIHLTGSEELNRVIDIASWWTAESTHDVSATALGPYSRWLANTFGGKNLPSDPVEMLTIFLSFHEPARREDLIAALIGCDLGWFQYLLGARREWLFEVLALRAALLITDGVKNFANGAGENKESSYLDFGDAELVAREEQEVSRLLAAISRPQKNSRTPLAEANDVAVVTCIDVRSEKLRRYLETRFGVDTLGFAGFFGADIVMVTESESRRFENQMCPVILAPSMRLPNNQLPSFHDYVPQLWHSANRGSGALAMAEGFGWIQLVLSFTNTFLTKYSWSRNSNANEMLLSESAYASISPEQKRQLAEALFQNLPLDRYHEVIFVGHESGVPNNPFKSLYECGACGGNSGVINAQLVARLLNDPEVLRAVGREGIQTTFRSALHNTTFQSITFDASASFNPELEGQVLMGEAEPQLGAWWQPFPEFGLSGNAGAIIGPRTISKEIDLEGRYFLHDYDYKTDPDGQKLANILTGPGQVMQMINSQYNFAVIDKKNFASGDKTRLNVFTQAGALQGSGGSLKRGMPWQALGFRADSPLHEPLRLQIFVAAPQELLNRALAITPLSRLAANGWVGIHPINVN